MRISPPTLALLQLMLGASFCTATSIDWTVNATLDDGATVTGFFQFDPDLGAGQAITDFNINVSAATPGTLTEPFDDNLPTSVFFPFDFTPANSLSTGDITGADGAFVFVSDTTFPDTLAGTPESLLFRFVPVSPLSDTSSTTITNSNINVNDDFSNECFDCDPYVCYAGASSSLCAAGTATTPEPSELSLMAFGICAFACAVMVRRRRPGVLGRHSLHHHQYVDSRHT
jgi:hypothetical protein